MRKRYLILLLLSTMATMFLPSRAHAADPPKAEYNDALAAIKEASDNGYANYYIVTEVNDALYYVTVDGTIAKWSEEEDNDGFFTISVVSGGGLYNEGFKIDGANGHFSNTTLSNDKAVLKPSNGAYRLDTSNNRADYESQVFFMNSEGFIAIRSCNVAYGESSWADAARAFWTYEVADADLTACYTYTPTYVWRLLNEDGEYLSLPSDRYKINDALGSIYNTYEDLVWDDVDEPTTVNMGEEFGQLTNWDAWRELYDLLQQVNGILLKFAEDPDYSPAEDPDAPSSLEEAQAWSAKADSLYQALLDSEVPYTVPDGYYRIIAHNRYKATTVGGETVLVDKAMAASFSKDHPNRVVYSNLDRDKANFVWKLTKSETGDSILIQNAGMETYISPIIDNSKLFMTPDLDKASYVMFDYAYAKDDDGDELKYVRGPQYVEPDGVGVEKDIINIRLASYERKSGGYSNYFHQNSHSSVTDENSPWGNYGVDTGTEQEMGLWWRTWDYKSYRTSDWNTSEWYLEPVDDDEAQELIEAFELIKNHDVLVAENNALRAEVLAAMTTAKDVIKTGLIKTASQMTSPHSENDLGSRDGGDLSAGVLIDGDATTYWHSAWQNTPEGPHYIQLSEMQDMIDDCEFYIQERDGAGNDRPAEFLILGSDDPDAETWEEIATIKVTNTDAGAKSYVPFHVEKAYPYVRLACTNTVGNNYTYRTFWHAAEIQIFTVRENPNSQFAALGEIAEALEETYNENVAIADADITLENYEALLAAYKAFLAGMVDPTELRNALAAYKSTTAGVEEGTEPGLWSDTQIADDYEALYGEIQEYDQAGRYNAAQNHKYAIMLKAMAKSVAETANGVKTDKWYHLMFPTEEMFTDYGYSTTREAESYIVDNPRMWGYYVVSGTRVQREEQEGDEHGWYDIEPAAGEDVREGMSMYFVAEEDIEDQDVSMFRFVERDEVEANYPALFSETMKNVEMALDMSTTYTRGEALIKDASQFSTNAPDRTEGTHIDYLVDGNANTFWHSDYHKDYLEPAYLQVALEKPVSGLIQLEVTRRQNSTYGHNERMYVLGSNDAATWTNVGYIETPYTTMNETVASQPIDLGGSYSYLRFILTKRAGKDQEYDPFAEITSASQYDINDPNAWTYFHVAEFQLYPVTADKELSASGKALFEARTAANKIILKDATAEDLAAAYDAYKAYRTEFNAAEGKSVLPLGTDKPATQYAIQNKATGLFVNCKDANNANNSLEVVPTYFEFSAPGFQRSFLHAWRLDGTNCSYLHAQNFDHRFVTWNDTNVDHNSGLVIREADEEYECPESFTFYKEIKPGQIAGRCSSVSLTPTPTEDFAVYTPLGQYTVEDEGIFLALKAIETIPAGEPAFYIYGDTLDYDAEDEYTEPIEFTIPGDQAPVLGNVKEGTMVNGVIGSLINHTLKPHEIYFSGNHAVCIGTTGYYIGGPCVVFELDECPQVDPDGEYDFSIFLGEAAEDAADGVKNVNETIEKISQRGNVYSMDGKLLMTGATLGNLKKLGKGMYILNGVKVLVK